MSNSVLMTLAQVREMTSIPRSTIYVMMQRGEFPCPIKITNHNVRWRREDVIKWIETRPKAKLEKQAA